MKIFRICTYYIKDDYFTESSDFKGQLNSEGINEVIVSPKMQTKITRISALPSNLRIIAKVNTLFIALFFGYFFMSIGSFLATIQILFGRAEILVILVCILGETMTFSRQSKSTKSSLFKFLPE